MAGIDNPKKFVTTIYPDARVEFTGWAGGLYRIVASKADKRGLVRVRPICGWTTCGDYSAWTSARSRIVREAEQLILADKAVTP